MQVQDLLFVVCLFIFIVCCYRFKLKAPNTNFYEEDRDSEEEVKGCRLLNVLYYFVLPPFSLTRDFGKQNTRGNVSKISVSLTGYRQIGSKSTNRSH